MSIWIARLVRLRWLLVLLCLLLIALLVAHYRHWDDRLSFWVQEQQVSAAEQAQSIWLPGYRAVLRVGHGCAGAATTAITVPLPSVAPAMPQAARRKPPLMPWDKASNMVGPGITANARDAVANINKV